MARTGMANLITQLRKMTNAGTADSTIGAETYWSDDHLQEILDTYRLDHLRVKLMPRKQLRSGSYVTYDYDIPRTLKWFEEAAGTLSGWYLGDSTGATVTADSINYERGEIHFATDTDDANYYLDCRTYNLNEAAAKVWEAKASFIYDAVDWSSDNHNIKAEQEYNHCLAQAKLYKNKSGAKVAKMIRSDEIGW